MPGAPQSVADVFRETVRRFPTKTALYSKFNGRWESMRWSDVSKQVVALVSFFTTRGLKAGDRIALLSENRPEWLITDLAALSIGAVIVPIYTSLSPAEIRYILNDSGCSWAAVSGKPLFEKIAAVQKELPSLGNVLAFDSAVLVDRTRVSCAVHGFQDAVKEAGTETPKGRRPSAEDIASVIYTSGTTGAPKGAMLTHGNFIENADVSREAFKMDENEVHLSFLPLCHVFERTCGHYLMIMIGASIAYAENMDTVPANIREIRPSFLLGVPRFYEKVQARVLEAVRKAGPAKKGLFAWAQELGRKRREKESLGLGALFLPLAESLVYKKFKNGLGGRLRFCVSGSAPLAKEIMEFFADFGVMIYEGYGLTETSPVISANREGKCKFGSVGPAFPRIEIKIADDGEILTRSACLMKGYWNRPAETAEVLKGGWFHTGDLGRMDSEGFLFITGRKKEIIITSGGKKVSPRAIEEMFERDEYILRCVLYGEGRRFLTALIVPDREALMGWATQNKIAHEDYASLLKLKKAYEFIDSRIQNMQQELAPYERVKYFALLENDFTQASGELTPTLKVKREAVHARYKIRLDPFYVE